MARWLETSEVDSLGQEESQWEGPPDPCAKYKGGWYFWDETWSNCCGPYNTREESRVACAKYNRAMKEGK